MTSLIVYYSYSGNTRKAAQVLGEFLSQKGEVEVVELQALDEARSFFKQCRRAFWHMKAAISSAQTELAKYDLICIGSPVWAFGPAPAVNSYLEKCSGLANKQVVLFTTYGSGTGNNRCLNYMQKILIQKGARGFRNFSVQQYKVGDKEFVLSKIKELF